MSICRVYGELFRFFLICLLYEKIYLENFRIEYVAFVSRCSLIFFLGFFGLFIGFVYLFFNRVFFEQFIFFLLFFELIICVLDNFLDFEVQFLSYYKIVIIRVLNNGSCEDVGFGRSFGVVVREKRVVVAASILVLVGLMVDFRVGVIIVGWEYGESGFEGQKLDFRGYLEFEELRLERFKWRLIEGSWIRVLDESGRIFFTFLVQFER